MTNDVRLLPHLKFIDKTDHYVIEDIFSGDSVTLWDYQLTSFIDALIDYEQTVTQGSED